ncbi:MAG: glycosyltransferase [Phycisphaerales bacterium]|nr:MAG: glycosyltransferase [Phycisphaerales bacterium]
MPMPEFREFDGVICFGGGDWWYHNRGHYDMQMMRHLSAHVPILYVNSIGIRVPSVREGSMFVRRVTRKLRSLSRGFKRVDERWGVCSPFAIPGQRGKGITRAVLPAQVRLAARRMGIRRPLVWVTCPPTADFVDALRPVASVYQRTDRWEEFPQANPAGIQRCDRLMKDKAEATLFCADLLFEEEGAGCRNPVYIDHGVDFSRFAEAGRRADAEGDTAAPEDVRELPHPRVGFIGGIDSHTFDPKLFLDVVQRLPDHRFFLVGACSLPEGWCPHANVTLLGQRPYEDVAAYMAAADVLIMPWNQNEWIRACNPVKLKEYLAAGRPIVTRDFYELRRYDGVVRIAGTADEFADAIRQGVASPDDPERLRARVEAQTWTAKAEALLAALAARGVVPVGTNAPSAAAMEPVRG